MLGTNLKTIFVLAGAITAVIGILIENWKVAAVGNIIATIGIIIP